MSEHFNVTHAAHLKLQLQALDAELSKMNSVQAEELDNQSGRNMSSSNCPHQSVYADGSEHLYLLVRRLPRPDLIPHVYFNAYAEVSQGRPHTNEYHVSDFKRGVDPTFSEIRPLLPQIDALCHTNLQGAFDAQEASVKPFPFLRLPAELRLQVYTHLLPRESHLALIYQPHCLHTPPRIHLDILRTNRQLHDEVVEYFFEKRILFMIAVRDKAHQTLCNQYLSQFHSIVAAIPPRTRQLFQNLEIQINYLCNQTITRDPEPSPSFVADPMRDIFRLLPNLHTLVIAFGTAPFVSAENCGMVRERMETVEWLVDCIPPSIHVLWDLTRAFTGRSEMDEMPLRLAVVSRGSLYVGESLSTVLAHRPSRIVQHWT